MAQPANGCACHLINHPNAMNMKQTILFLCAAALLMACNNGETDTTASANDSASTTTTTTTTSTNTSQAYSPGEGDVSYRDRKVVVYRNGAWTESDKDVTLDDGTVVRRNGRIVHNGEEADLDDGVVVDKSGRFFDKAGNAIEDGWQGLKKGAKKVGDAAEKGFDKAKEGVKDAVNDDDKKKQ